MYEDKKYAPISAWGYFGYELLFNIPVAGLILLIVFAFSNKNINRRNFARAHFCFLALILIVLAAMAIISITLGISDKLTIALSDFFNTISKKI